MTYIYTKPGNATLTALKDKAQPLWDKEEKARKAGLSPTEKMKEEGDELYKQAKFEEVGRGVCVGGWVWRMRWNE